MLKSLTDVAIKNADLGEIEAVFSTFDVIDKDNDVTRKGSFTEGAPVVISSYGHTSWSGHLPIGKGTIHEDGDRAVMKGRMFLNTSHGRDAWETVKELSADGLQEWSYSLADVTAESGEVDGKSVRIITRVGFVKEVSPVLVGAGVDTTTLSTKSHQPDDGLKFADHIAAVLADVGVLLDRTDDVMAIRSAKGKSLSPDAKEALDLVEQSLVRLRGLAEPATESDPAIEAFLNEEARAIAISLNL